MFRWTQTLLLGAFVTLAHDGTAHAADKQSKINTNESAYAIDGYDPVAYFEEGKAVHGKVELAYDHRGARWLFSNEARRQKFIKTPAAFAPQYDGYCAYGVSRGNLVTVDPRAWTVRDGKLYLNYSLEIRKQWLSDVQARIQKADAIFPTLAH
jgi:hypothetical protein